MVTQTLELRKSIFLTAVRIQGPLQRPKKSKNRAKRGSKIQNHILSCQTGSGSVQNSYFGCKNGFLPKRGTQKDISDCKQTLGAQKGQKRAKNRPKRVKKTKIAFYEGKWDFKKIGTKITWFFRIRASNSSTEDATNSAVAVNSSVR